MIFIQPRWNAKPRYLTIYEFMESQHLPYLLVIVYFLTSPFIESKEILIWECFIFFVVQFFFCVVYIINNYAHIVCPFFFSFATQNQEILIMFLIFLRHSGREFCNFLDLSKISTEKKKNLLSPIVLKTLNQEAVY